MLRGEPAAEQCVVMNNVGFLNSTSYATLPTWQAASTQDANSVVTAPVFNSTTDLHLIPGSNVLLNNLGTPIAAVTTKVADLPTPLQFQVPRVHGTRLRQTAISAADAVVALAAQKADGSWLVATLTARAAAK